MRTKRTEWKSAAARRLLALGDPSCASVEAAVEVVAQRLLEGIEGPPTDLGRLGSRLNVSAIEPVDGLPFSGELRRSGSTLVVAYASWLAPGRRRFTIAHELGHAVFETTGPNCPRYGQELERLCDMLASEFVFPRRAFIERARVGFGPSTIFELSKAFEASLQATSFRCSQLLKASVFQVDQGIITWGFGEVKRHRDLDVDESAFRTAFSRAMNGESGQLRVHLRTAEQTLQWAAMPGGRRALFTAHRCRPTAIAGK